MNVTCRAFSLSKRFPTSLNSDDKIFVMIFPSGFFYLFAFSPLSLFLLLSFPLSHYISFPFSLAICTFPFFQTNIKACGFVIYLEML